MTRTLLLCIPLALLSACGPRAVSHPSLSLAPVPRVSPDALRPRVTAGQALLVCAFSDEDACYRDVMPKALLLADFRRRAETLPRSTELIFYCACDGDSTALRVAAAFRSRGWSNVKVLKGGPAAWKGTPDLI